MQYDVNTHHKYGHNKSSLIGMVPKEESGWDFSDPTFHMAADYS